MRSRGRGPHDGISPWKGREGLLPLSVLCHVRIQVKSAASKHEEAQPRTWPYYQRQLGLPDSRAIRSKCLLFLSRLVYGIIVVAQMD